VTTLYKKRTVVQRFFTTQVGVVEYLEQTNKYRSPDLKVRIKAIECHKLSIARLEGYFAQLVEVETDFEVAVVGTTDNVAQAAHYYHFHIYEELNMKIQENASHCFQNVEAEKLRDKEGKEKLRLEMKSVTLLRLNLPTFHGKSSAEWASFIRVFSALMDKSQTENSEKFTYLKLSPR
jgi:hypothetical protein